MVVARKTELVVSHTSESVEDLLIIPVSETESEDGDVNPIPRLNPKRYRNCAVVPTSSSVACAKGSGKRKRRQYENFVDLLGKGPVEFHMPTIHDFLPDGHRSLLRLLEECSIFEAFCYGCEDFLEKLDVNCSGRKENQGRWRFIKSLSIKTSTVPSITSEESPSEKKSLPRVEEPLRDALLAGEISQTLVKELEDKLVDFFVSTPRETFISRGLSSVERAIVGAICTFHHLQYKCYRKRRYHVVQVQNSNYMFESPEIHLSSVLMKYQGCGGNEIVKLCDVCV